MDVKIHTIHFDADQQLLDFVNKKVGKIDKLDLKITDLQVSLKLDAAIGGVHAKVAQIKANLPGKTIFSEEEAFTFEDAVEAAVDNALTQIKKHKEKQNIG
ncbi:MAG: HPF/RaiA family ribosome-associated protein [Chitinophagales bacterium]|jgi:putative sigma-54 modulation protein|nr:ribosome-associated translation inhibitor RaiA [Bacteroidota bacterium]MBK9504541.1 ribosome-associated translation inhibitor RaiA [Bacteroidota bacterium]MBK9557309.1 ribosome-associated translation inhibitor RaiA [Bacteroidota bacterium]